MVWKFCAVVVDEEWLKTLGIQGIELYRGFDTMI